ncbi:hypothetical protein DPEC_G00270160 [Dallia pectoralis]|uniref:Uncharacterized protein n=1 Tax=Dallia pectoralis TaxID=75939 RepID=A0ACC2FPB5_DALPE|nr:hypothetical protein DPEC_G00270160 [Dallia pectoralis]
MSDSDIIMAEPGVPLPLLDPADLRNARSLPPKPLPDGACTLHSLLCIPSSSAPRPIPTPPSQSKSVSGQSGNLWRALMATATSHSASHQFCRVTEWRNTRRTRGFSRRPKTGTDAWLKKQDHDRWAGSSS